MKTTTEGKLEKMAYKHDKDYGVITVPKDLMDKAEGYVGEQHYDLSTYFEGYMAALEAHGIKVDTVQIGYTHSNSYGEIDEMFLIKEAVE
jgi:DNA-binding LacI/PurR family transcriptional regulator